MTSNSQKPVASLRDGYLSASIWQNQGEKGIFFAVTFSRAYTDSAGKIQYTGSYSGSDLLKLSRIAQQAYDAINQLRADNGNGDHEPDDQSNHHPAPL